METTVEKLEAMFLKSEADLDYIEKRLKLDFINSAAENGCPAEENPAVMLENLRAIKAKHTELCSQVKEIAAAQKESMDSIRNNLSSAMELVQHFQQTTDVEVQPLTESEQESAELLGSAVTDTTTQVPPAEAASGQQQPLSCEYEEVSEAMLEVVPLSMRSNIKLADLNVFYQQLQQHLSKDSGSLSMQKIKQLKMKVSDTKLKVLQHLSLVELDKKGHVRLIM
ncbi:SKA complex subunit 2 isoform X5 [Epinephelus lanceolatus]|uniref:spindle and kinetochore-associated protein 2 isoform X6 n=1 Tax=Epinephelus lanceolatus TaxID=310571 RepID=UPI0014450D0F|nr:spindle and kinetochore-associated protein 2 isoform X6 [Epinephelus lanceolatus]XP_033504485.1 spindle and kinetochore-associated protein 2 isoform X6 [Epinephelus lanceolatus]